MFNEEQIERLAKYESYFESAVIANYVRNIPSDKLAEVISTWQEASGETVKEKMTCGVCQLNFFKKVGKQYFADKKKFELEKIRKKIKEQDETKKKTGGSTKRNSTSTRKSQSNTGDKRKSKRGSEEDSKGLDKV